MDDIEAVGVHGIERHRHEIAVELAPAACDKNDHIRRIEHNATMQGEHPVAVQLLRIVRHRRAPGRQAQAVVVGGEYFAVAPFGLAAGPAREGAAGADLVERRSVPFAEEGQPVEELAVGVELGFVHG